MELRPYQALAVERTRRAIRGGKRRVLIAAPTGAGKTVIAVKGIIEPAVAKGRRVLFLAHRTELIAQCASKISGRVGIIKAGILPTPDAPVQVASVQTLVRREPPSADVVIVDECHHQSDKNTYGKIISNYPDAVVLGLTATPYTLSGRGFEDCYDDLVEVASIAELMRLGFLVRPRTFALPGPSLAGVRTLAGDYREDQLAVAMDVPRIGTALVETWKRWATGRATIAFAVNVAHSKHVAEQFTAAGITCEHVDGETPATERAAILARLASGVTSVVTNCGVLTEGFDCPLVSCVILARPTKSRGLWRQMIGRGLRSHPGKQDCQIHDHAGCRLQHGEVEDGEELTLAGMKRRPVSAAPPVRQCLSCYAVVPAACKACPECGEEFPVREATPPEGVHAVLEEASPVTLAAQRARYLHQLIAIAVKRGWKPGAVSHKFKEKFGTWPGRIGEVEAMMREHARPKTLAEMDAEYVRS